MLLGHSAGGMATLDLCRQFPERLGPRVAGLVLVNTTDHDPVRTTTAAGLFTALRTPLLTPLLWLTVWLWPLRWLSSWLSYANGTAHLAAWLTGFAGRPERGQLDAAARLNTRTSPAVLARGVLGMFRYDARATLASIGVPVLVVTGDRDRVLVPQVSARHAGGPAGGRAAGAAPGGPHGQLGAPPALRRGRGRLRRALPGRRRRPPRAPRVGATKAGCPTWSGPRSRDVGGVPLSGG